MGIAIAQNLFLNKLTKVIPFYTPEISPQAVVAVGATGVTKLARNPEILLALREAYAQAIRSTLILALAGACVAFPCAWGMEWLNTKEVAKARRVNNADLGETPMELNTNDVALEGREKRN